MGCGWLGLPLASKFVEDGFSVHGSTTSKEKIEVLEESSISPFLISLSEKGITGNISGFLENIEILVVNVPPKLRGGKGENYVKKMQLLHREIVKSSVSKALFVSSTSVYGEIDGSVTEDTVPFPSTESGKQLLEAEKLFQNNPSFSTTILRFGGLIGPKRHPIQMLAGRKNLSHGNSPVNLIHLNDCIGIISQIIEKSWWNEIINGVFPEHPSKQEYYTAKAKEMNLQAPDYKEDMLKKGKTVVSNFLLNVKNHQFTTTL